MYLQQKKEYDALLSSFNTIEAKRSDYIKAMADLLKYPIKVLQKENHLVIKNESKVSLKP